MKNKKSFGNQLKHLRQQKKITQKELSMNLGIGQTAVANYENGNRFPDEKILINLADFFNITIDKLIGRNHEPVEKIDHSKSGFEYLPSGLDESCEDFITSALESSRKGVRLIKNLLAAGYSEEQIMIDLLGASLIKTGTRWAEGIFNEAMEHQISAAAVQAMVMMQTAFEANKPFRGRAVCLPPSGEGHNIGLRMVSRFLEIDGWESFFLETSVPAQSLRNFILKAGINLVVISITLKENAEPACSLIKGIKTMQSPPAVIAGGPGLKYNEKYIKEAGADYISESVNNTISWTRGI